MLVVRVDVELVSQSEEKVKKSSKGLILSKGYDLNKPFEPLNVLNLLNIIKIGKKKPVNDGIFFLVYFDYSSGATFFFFSSFAAPNGLSFAKSISTGAPTKIEE